MRVIQNCLNCAQYTQVSILMLIIIICISDLCEIFSIFYAYGEENGHLALYRGSSATFCLLSLIVYVLAIVAGKLLE